MVWTHGSDGLHWNVLLLAVCFTCEERSYNAVLVMDFSGAGSILKRPEDVSLVSVGIASGFFDVKDDVTAMPSGPIAGLHHARLLQLQVVLPCIVRRFSWSCGHSSYCSLHLALQRCVVVTALHPALSLGAVLHPQNGK